jgi:hypothetical protein
VHLVGPVFNIYKMHGENNIKYIFLSICITLCKFYAIKFNKKNLHQIWGIKQSIHAALSIFLSYLYFIWYCVYKMTFNVIGLFENWFAADGRSMGVTVLTGIQLTWESDFKVQHVCICRYSSGRMLMHTVRGKEIAPCYYPYQTTQQLSDDDVKTSCMGSGRNSRQRSPTKDDLSPSRCWWF